MMREIFWVPFVIGIAISAAMTAVQVVAEKRGGSKAEGTPFKNFVGLAGLITVTMLFVFMLIDVLAVTVGR